MLILDFRQSLANAVHVLKAFHCFQISMLLKSLYQSSRTSRLTLVCSCTYLNPARSFANHSRARRGLSTTTTLLKKGGGKQEQKRTVEINSAKTEGRDDARDFSIYRHEIDKTIDVLEKELSKLRAGGLDLEAIEALNVNLGSSGGGGGGDPKKDGSRSGGKGKGDRVKLGDVAQVVPRGRIVVIMVGEKEVCSILRSIVSLDKLQHIAFQKRGCNQK